MKKRLEQNLNQTNQIPSKQKRVFLIYNLKPTKEIHQVNFGAKKSKILFDPAFEKYFSEKFRTHLPGSKVYE